MMEMRTVEDVYYLALKEKENLDTTEKTMKHR
jgi:hypothetical protein